MARLEKSYDVANMPVSDRNFEPLPAGWYLATITAASVEKTKSGTGSYIKMRYDITGPTHQGRVVFGNLNIKNANPKAEEIANKDLGEIMRAIGLARVDDTDQLIGHNLSIKLAVRLSPEFGDSNEVKGFKSIDGAMPPVGGPPRPTSSAPAASPSKPPWAK